MYFVIIVIGGIIAGRKPFVFIFLGFQTKSFHPSADGFFQPFFSIGRPKYEYRFAWLKCRCVPAFAERNANPRHERLNATRTNGAKRAETRATAEFPPSKPAVSVPDKTRNGSDVLLCSARETAISTVDRWANKARARSANP